MSRDEAFLSLFLRHQGDLRAFLGSVVRDRTAVDDLLQDVGLVLWRKFDDYDRARPFGAWARGIAANRVLQEREKKVPLAFSPAAIRAVADAYDRQPPPPENLGRLRDCLKKLTGKSRQLLALRYEEGLKLHEIGRRVNATLDAVHKALSRIREALERCVAGP